jgi:hypothetical protein
MINANSMFGISCVIGILVVIIIITCYFSMDYCKRSIIADSLTGYWVADKSYCDEADIDLFCILIGRQEHGKRSCYILAKQDDELIINEPTTITFNQINMIDSKFTEVTKCGSYEFNVSFDELETKEFPRHQQMTYYLNHNKLVFHIDDKVYAVLYNNPVLTEQYNDINH